MIHAYSELYLECARSVMAHMFDYAVHGLGYNMKDFFEIFLVSPICEKIERGDAFTIAGKSGVELAIEVAQLNECPVEPEEVFLLMHRTPEFWLGWALAYYQWFSGHSFSEILSTVPLSRLIDMYPVFHEMDITHFADHMNDLMKEASPHTRLRDHRVNCGMSQTELAADAGVALRQIQLFEQRQRDINNAAAITLLKLSRSLHCRMEDLMEY